MTEPSEYAFPPPPSEAEPEPEPQHHSKRALLGSYLHDGWSKSVEFGKDGLVKGKELGRDGLVKGKELGRDGLIRGQEMGKDELIKSKLKLQHALGLGPQPNVIPPGEPIVDGDLRTVEIGWHPVLGMAGIAKSGLGKMITKSIGKYPDPTQHWAVLVGEYVHELWMDEDLDIIYINEKINRDEWHTFEVGRTRFTDEAVKQAAEMVIHNMREKRPAYNVISNNCQNYAVNLLDAIQIGAHREFATTFAIYQRATGAGTIKDLFEDKHPEEQKVNMEERPELHRTDTVQVAQQVMDEHTTKLDDHHSLFG